MHFTAHKHFILPTVSEKILGSFIEGIFLHKINEVFSNEGAGLHFAKCSKLQENCKLFNSKTL